MTPLETIKEGILKGDMMMVATGYNRITNESVYPQIQQNHMPEPQYTPQQIASRRRIGAPVEEERFVDNAPDFTSGGDNYIQPKEQVAARPEQFVQHRDIVVDDRLLIAVKLAGDFGQGLRVIDFHRRLSLNFQSNHSAADRRSPQ